MINVDFDFMNLNPDVDHIALKRLLRQTLSHDDHLVDVHTLADLILEEGTRLKAGSTIKTDGEESDPWGLLAAVDLNRCSVSRAVRSGASGVGGPGRGTGGGLGGATADRTLEPSTPESARTGPSRLRLPTVKLFGRNTS